MPLGVVEVGRHGDDSMGDLLSEKCLGSLLHIGEHHGGDLLCGECLLTLAGLNLDMGLGVLVDQLEGEGLDVRLHGLVGDAWKAIASAASTHLKVLANSKMWQCRAGLPSAQSTSKYFKILQN